MQLAKMNPRYLPAFIGLGLFLLAMLAACTAPSAVAVPTAEPTPLTISTELSNCVTTIAYLATKHGHKSGGGSPQLALTYDLPPIALPLIISDLRPTEALA